MVKTILGVDVSKKTLDVVYGGLATPLSKKVENNIKGFEVIAGLIGDDGLVVMESTGGYELELAEFLVKRDIPVTIQNPYQVSAYSNSLNRRNKTDRADAYILMRLGHERFEHLSRWSVPSAESRELSRRYRLLVSIQRDKRRVENRLCLPNLEKWEQHEYEVQFRFLSKRYALAMKHIENFVWASSLNNNFKLLLTIPGVGPRVAIAFLAEVGDVSRFPSARKLAAYLGVSPSQFQSGTSVRRTSRMNKKGGAFFRATAWLPAMTSKRVNKSIARAIGSMLERNPTLSANMLTGVALHKLVRIMYGVLKNQTAYNSDWHHQRTTLRIVA